MATIHMNEATEQIRSWLLGRGRSDNTVKAYTTDVNMFFLEMEIDQVDTCQLEELAAQWMNAKRRLVAPKTLGRRITSMRAWGRCLGIPMLPEYSAPTPARAIPHPLPGLDKDLRNMINCARTEEIRALLALTGMCGLRISEARSVGPKDFDLQEMMLTVRGKGDQTRMVPISKEAWTVMCSRVIECHLSGAQTIIAFSDRYAREIITQLGRKAGVKRDVSSHDLRATYATLAYAASGRDIRVVQELLGHRTVEQTALYTGVSLAAMRGATNLNIFSEEDE